MVDLHGPHSDGQLWVPGVWETFVATLHDGVGPKPWWYERGMSDRLIREALRQNRSDDVDDDADGWI